MAKFVYKLQSILNLKSKMEEQAKNEYAIAKSALDAENEKLTKLAFRKSQYEEQLRSQVESYLNIKDIMHSREAIKTFEYLIEDQKQKVALEEKKVEKARVKMNAAMIDRKTHEKLKENAFEEFVREINHEESKETDELVSYKYNNTKNSEDV